MKQEKKIVLETTEQQQVKLIRKLEKELVDLQLAIEDKEKQIKLQKQVLYTIIYGKDN